MTDDTKKPKKKKSPSISKSEILFNNLLKITEQYISGKNYFPQTFEQLLLRLSLPPQHHPIFEEILNNLFSSGFVQKTEDKYHFNRISKDLLIGVMHLHPRGFGFVTPEHTSKYNQDIFIPKHLTNNAVDGDQVEVEVNQEVFSEKGPEGRVTAVLSRGRTHAAGIIKAKNRFGELLVHIPLLGSQQNVVLESTAERELNIGDRIVMEVIDWGSKETETLCRFSHYIGNISDPSTDIPAAIEEFELRNNFPSHVIEEASNFGKTVSLKEIKLREDLRHLTTMTIDPDTAKDFDDALSLTIDEQGNYDLGVHIADVSHYVKPGTALDSEAQLRCNSTYFPRVCIPMLPKELSENLCSLKPNVNRLTVSVLIKFTPLGDLLEYRIVKSIIKSVKRFTYKEAKKVLDGTVKSPHTSTLELMVELCRLLKKKRYERGSIEFSLPELVILVDEKGIPTGTDYIAYDVTHQMVEEFMLKANELVAWDLSNKGKNLTYRIHDVPAEENIRDFAFLAAAFGFRIPDYPTPQDIQKLFEEAQETPFAAHLASNYIRRMRLAVYSAENIGHYGLSLTHYCHFTSPIRRYVDLVVHRILFGESDDFESLRTIALKCSEQERISAKAESSVVLLKKLRLIQSIEDKTPHNRYSAIVTRVKNFGIYFEVIDYFLEGFVHISDLGNDYYIYEETQLRLRGRQTGETFTPGTQLKVILQGIDFTTSDCKWMIDEHEAIIPVVPIRKKSMSPSRDSFSPEKQKMKKKPLPNGKTKTKVKSAPPLLKTKPNKSPKKSK